MKNAPPKNPLAAITHPDIAEALKGKTSCACGGTTVYRCVVGTGTQSFDYQGVLVSKDYEFQPRATLRCEDCHEVVARPRRSP